MAEVIITGCDLHVPDHGKWCHGDLWAEGEVYVFNACLEKGEAAWQYEAMEENAKRLTILSEDYFERRGVIVVAAASAELSIAAKEYLK